MASRVLAPCEIGQPAGVTFTSDQRLQHGPAGHAEDIGDHRGQLDLDVFENLLDALLVPDPFADQYGPYAGEIPQSADPLGRHERGPEHAAFGQDGQPDRIELVGLGADLYVGPRRETAGTRAAVLASVAGAARFAEI